MLPAHRYLSSGWMNAGKAGKKKKRGRILAELQKHPEEFAVLKFLVKFNLFAVPLYLILIANLRLELLETFTADITSAILNSMGILLERAGNYIIVPVANGSWGAFINWDCTGWKSFLALFALVMASDFHLKNRLKGLAVLLPALFVINIARIVFMFWFVNAFDLAYFDAVHAVIWSWGLIAAILVLWFLWMRYSLRKGSKKK
jgi:exosortase/archaeosortase family protein